ncbi:hypothetical protein E0H26_09705 [Micromonospora zingiberis]|uniref:Uncharacterized protein n=1 Tax=Micromonospora zingiberis TaxID=2053011 RepID=A0A4R0GQ77_9ACTN|nr:hypothetical protein [Micromonospora zingiberis]TCB97869.1 hypothetical protein E0H26_09705 [Micromonospora zingiberis]
MEPGTNVLNLVIQCSAGVFWTIAYLLMIRKGNRDLTYAMPLAALGANISWEALYAFIIPPPHPDPTTWVAQVTVNAVWFIFDLLLVWQALRYGPKEFPGIARAAFFGTFAGVTVLAFGTVVMVNVAFDDRYGVHAGLGQNVMMSALFLAMLQARRSSRGQSVGIAVTKMLGTLCAGGGAWLYPATEELGQAVLVPYLTLVCLLLDLAYLVGLLIVRRRERATRPTDVPTSPEESFDDRTADELPLRS